MKNSASEIKNVIQTQLECDHLPYIVGLNKHDYSDANQEDCGLTPEELAMIQDDDEEYEENKSQEEHVKFGAYKIFIIQGDLNKIKNEIIVPLQIDLQKSKRPKLDL